MKRKNNNDFDINLHHQIIKQSVDFINIELEKLYKQLETVESAPHLENYTSNIENLMVSIKTLIRKLSFEEKELNRLARLY